ncbi:hypothetical protein Hanom_Chr11g01024661 [Helianthus anomalus]
MRLAFLSLFYTLFCCWFYLAMVLAYYLVWLTPVAAIEAPSLTLLIMAMRKFVFKPIWFHMIVLF